MIRCNHSIEDKCTEPVTAKHNDTHRDCRMIARNPDHRHHARAEQHGKTADQCSDPQKLDLKAWESNFLRFFLCGEMFATILSRTEPAERLLDAALIVVDDILFDRRLEFLVTMVDVPIVNLLL